MNYWNDKTILLTGGRGFLGSFIFEKLVRGRGVDPARIRIPSRENNDLRRWENCVDAVKNVDVVIHLAARVGGIGFNQKWPATLFYDNAIMGIQLMEAARQQGTTKFVALGTVCAYPKLTPVPFREEHIWDGYPEETNAPYGIAKKLMLVQSTAYRDQYGFDSIFLLPVNLYGPRDEFDPDRAHVIPALIRKMEDARRKGTRTVTLWGTGKASREFLFVEDAAEGILLATEHYDKPDPVNLGSGKEITISGLADIIKELTGYNGDVTWDTGKPDGQPRRSLDVSRAKKEFAFEAKTSLADGLEKTIRWYRENFLSS